MHSILDFHVICILILSLTIIIPCQRSTFLLVSTLVRKTLFRVLLVTLLDCALNGFTIEECSIKTNLRNVLINAVSRSPKFIFSNFYSIIAPFLIPLHEIFIHPIFNRCFPRLKSYKKCLVGIAIRFVRYVTLLANTHHLFTST